MGREKKEPITLMKFIWRTNLKLTILPIVVLELLLLGIFIHVNYWVGANMSESWKDDINNELHSNVCLEADTVNQKFESIRINAHIYADQLLDALSSPVYIDADVTTAEDLLNRGFLRKAAVGSYYMPRSLGGASIYYTGAVPIGSAELLKLTKVFQTERIMQDLYNANDLISSIHFNSYDSLNISYPYDGSAFVFEPKTDLTTYNFYNEAAAELNPERNITWTEAYTDPVSHDYVVSCLAPVYSGDFLEGVAGVDVTVDMIAKRILHQDTPWGGYMLLIDEKGMVLNMPQNSDALDILGDLLDNGHNALIDSAALSVAYFNIYDQENLQPLTSALQMADEGLKSTELGGEMKLVIWNNISETGWKLMAVYPEKTIYARNVKITEAVYLAGKLVVGTSLLFYTAYLVLLVFRARQQSGIVVEPLMEMAGIARRIGDGEYEQTAPTYPIKEFQETADCIVSTGWQLGQTHQKLVKVQAWLQENQQYLKTVLDTSSDMILEFGRDAEFIKFVTTGQVSAEVLARFPKSLDGFLEPKDVKNFTDTVNWVLDTGEPISVDYRVKTIDGRQVHNYRLSRLNVNPPRVVVTVRDITFRYATVEALREARDEAREANRVKTTFLSGMSHELRTPLNAILGFAQILKFNKKNPLPPEQQEYAGEIIKAGTHLLELINDILDLSNLEAGQIKLALQPVNINALMQETTALIMPVADRMGVTLRLVEINMDRNYVPADKTKLKQVLINLLGNAVKYNKPGGRVDFFCEEDGDRLRLHVSDTGYGFAEEEKEAIFKAFYRAPGAAQKADGTGVGLAIVKNIVTAMGGTIGVASVPGAGSHFWVELPTTDGPDALMAVEAAGIVQTPFEGKKVLYIEDNPPSRRLLKLIVEQELHTPVLLAASGKEGINTARAELPDLILADLDLPDMDGFELYKQLNKFVETRGIPVIAVSASAMEETIKKALDSGFCDYITKPFDAVTFIRKIVTMLG